MRKTDLRAASRASVWTSEDLASDWNPLFDDDEPLGKYWSEHAMSDEEVEIVRQFLIRLKKGSKEMSKKEEATEKINMVFLAGTLKFDPKTFDNGTKALIDTGQKQAVQVGARDAIGKKLAQFRQGDFIRTVAIIEPYGVKQDDGTWKNGISIRLTEIKTPAPVRKEYNSQSVDDNIPY